MAAHGTARLTQMARLTDGLVGAGLTDDTIAAVLGGNFSRLFTEVMDNAKENAHV